MIIEQFPRGKNLLVCAHPDDETIFAYSTLAAHPDDWTVICATNYGNPVRSAEFAQVMEKIGVAAYEMRDFPDEWGGGFPSGTKDWIRDALTLEHFDNVLTHNQFGEYGHKQHGTLHYIVKSLITNEHFYEFIRGLQPLNFNTLQAKLETLKLYKSQYDLNAYDWYDQNNPTNRLMNYVVSEGFRRNEEHYEV